MKCGFELELAMVRQNHIFWNGRVLGRIGLTAHFGKL